LLQTNLRAHCQWFNCNIEFKLKLWIFRPIKSFSCNWIVLGCVILLKQRFFVAQGQILSDKNFRLVFKSVPNGTIISARKDTIKQITKSLHLMELHTAAILGLQQSVTTRPTLMKGKSPLSTCCFQNQSIKQ